MTHRLTPQLTQLVDTVQATEADLVYSLLDSNPTRYADAYAAREAARAHLVAALDGYPRPCVLEGVLSDGQPVAVKYYRDELAERRAVRIETA